MRDRSRKQEAACKRAMPHAPAENARPARPAMRFKRSDRRRRINAGGFVIEPGLPRRGVPRSRPGGLPEILVRRAAHSPRSCPVLHSLQHQPLAHRAPGVLLEARMRIRDRRRQSGTPSALVHREAALPALQPRALRPRPPSRAGPSRICVHRHSPVGSEARKREARRFEAPGFAGNGSLCSAFYPVALPEIDHLPTA